MTITCDQSLLRLHPDPSLSEERETRDTFKVAKRKETPNYIPCIIRCRSFELLKMSFCFHASPVP